MDGSVYTSFIESVFQQKNRNQVKSIRGSINCLQCLTLNASDGTSRCLSLPHVNLGGVRLISVRITLSTSTRTHPIPIPPTSSNDHLFATSLKIIISAGFRLRVLLQIPRPCQISVPDPCNDWNWFELKSTCNARNIYHCYMFSLSFKF